MPKSNDLQKALRENLKLRRQLATEVAEAKGQKLIGLRLGLMRIFGAFRYALFGTFKPVSGSRQSRG
jgi:predicted secreted protein